MAQYTGKQINGGRFLTLFSYSRDWGWVKKCPTRPALHYVKSQCYFAVRMQINGVSAFFLSRGAIEHGLTMNRTTDEYTPTTGK